MNEDRLNSKDISSDETFKKKQPILMYRANYKNPPGLVNVKVTFLERIKFSRALSANSLQCSTKL